MSLLESPAFGWHNLLDDAGVTFTCAVEDAAYPLSNLGEPDFGDVFRTTTKDMTGNPAKVDFGAQKDWQAIALPGSNWTEGATLAVEKSNDGSSWTAVSGTFGGVEDSWPNGMTPRNMPVFLAATKQTSRYVRWVVVDTGNAASYLESKRGIVTELVQPEIPQQYGSYTYGKTPAGNRTLELAFEWLTSSEAIEKFFGELGLAVGGGGEILETPWGALFPTQGQREVLVVPNPTSTTLWWLQNLFGYCTEFGDVTDQEFTATGDRWGHKSKYKEILG